MNPPKVVVISECFVKPQQVVEESKQPCYLAPWDLAMLSINYIQKGFLFTKQPLFSIDELTSKLKLSLSKVLVHFYPLAGRLETSKQEDPHSYVIFIDCNKGPGARLIRAELNMTISDIVSPVDVPLIVQSFFDHDRAVNHDGHTRPLLSVQVTELIDGVFIGCSISHVVVDGTSFWHFLNSWSEIFNSNGEKFEISRPPIHQHYFPDGYGPIINLPYKDHSEFIIRYEPPLLRERMFHFSAESKANSECSSTNKISSFQALCALMWRTITRARSFPNDQITSCRLAINNRLRLNPPLSQNYFGNCIQNVRGVSTSGELLSQNLGWAAWKLHEAVIGHNDEKVHEWLDELARSSLIYNVSQFIDPWSVMIGSSPRFDMYGNEFGLGKAVALRSGYANKCDGNIASYPGYEGGGSVDLEMCLPPESMAALESDEEFLAAVDLAD